MHTSTSRQLAVTLSRFFADHDRVWVFAIPRTDKFAGDRLRFERDGCGHIYGVVSARGFSPFRFSFWACFWGSGVGVDAR